MNLIRAQQRWLVKRRLSGAIVSRPIKGSLSHEVPAVRPVLIAASVALPAAAPVSAPRVGVSVSRPWPSLCRCLSCRRCEGRDRGGAGAGGEGAQAGADRFGRQLVPRLPLAGRRDGDAADASLRRQAFRGGDGRCRPLRPEYGYPAAYGIKGRLAGVPAVLIVDPKTNKLINAGRETALADARSMTPQAVADWLAGWVG